MTPGRRRLIMNMRTGRNGKGADCGGQSQAAHSHIQHTHKQESAREVHQYSKNGGEHGGLPILNGVKAHLFKISQTA